MKCPLCGGTVKTRRRSQTVAMDCEACTAFSVHQRPDPKAPGSTGILVEMDFSCGVVTVPAEMPGSNVVPVTLSDGRVFNVRVRNGVLTGYPGGQAVTKGRWLKDPKTQNGG